MTIIIVLAIIAILVIWVISVQRSLVAQDEKCNNSMSQIGVQQQSRWDALSALVDLVKSYNEHEYNTLKEVVAMRRNITGTSTAADVNAQDKAMGGLLRDIQVVAEQYPDLKANENYGKLMDSVNTYENQVRMSRMVYNDSATKYNTMVRQFPGSLVAGFLHFNSREYIQEVAEKAEMPSMKI
ncbi:MAG: LemA family protein [Bacteroidales bacterium]|nr:LemA family protein [Bacteroidales bacterium]